LLAAGNAFDAGRKVVTTDLDSLLKQYRRFEFDNTAHVAVLAEDLKPRENVPPRKVTIFLDEIVARRLQSTRPKNFSTY